MWQRNVSGRRERRKKSYSAGKLRADVQDRLSPLPPVVSDPPSGQQHFSSCCLHAHQATLSQCVPPPPEQTRLVSHGTPRVLRLLLPHSPPPTSASSSSSSLPQLPLHLHIPIKSLAHIALDTVLFNGHSTGLDTLWAGRKEVERGQRTVRRREGRERKRRRGEVAYGRRAATERGAEEEGRGGGRAQEGGAGRGGEGKE
eukprot:765954-Hanusia_phi.AAC.3